MAYVTPYYGKDGKTILSWKVTVYLGKDNQNKYIRQVMRIKADDSRLDGLSGAKLQKEVQFIADNWEHEQKEEFEKTHSISDRNVITLFDFIDHHWFPDRAQTRNHTVSTVLFYKNNVRIIKDYFGEKKRLCEIDAESLIRFINFLTLKARKENGDPFSPTYALRCYQTLRTILRYAVMIGYIAKDPCVYIDSSMKPHSEHREIDYLPPEEARTFLHMLDKECLDALNAYQNAKPEDEKKLFAKYVDREFWRCLINTLMRTGIRRGEAIGLKWKDIDQKSLLLKICRNVTIDKGAKDKIHIGSPKGKDSREIRITESLMKMFLNLKCLQAQLYGTEPGNESFVFCSTIHPEKPIYPSEPTKYVSNFIKRNKLPNVSPHDLRHTAATLALESGADIKQIQDLLGHKDPETTMQFYAAVTEAGKRRTVEGIDRVLGYGEKSTDTDPDPENGKVIPLWFKSGCKR